MLVLSTRDLLDCTARGGQQQIQVLPNTKSFGLRHPTCDVREELSPHVAVCG